MDLYLEKFQFKYQDPNENSDYIQLNIKKSVFRDKIKTLKRQQVKSNKKSRKNLLKKIIQKEKKNQIFYFYKIFAFFWVTFLLVLTILKLVNSYDNIN